MITFSDAKSYLAEFVGTGYCPTHPDVARDINDACRRLLQAADSDYGLDILRIWTQNNSITLPREYVAARMVRIGYEPREIYSPSFEFLQNGPTNLFNTGTSFISEGVGHPCFFEIPRDKAYGLFAVSTDPQDVTKSLSIRCLNNDGSLVLSSASPDLSLPIAHWNGGSEGSLTYQPTNALSTTVGAVKQVLLPAGLRGYISFYAIDPDEGYMWFLSRYHPDETRPGYQRYRLPRFVKGEDSDGIRGTGATDGLFVECLCKKRHIDMTRDNDLLSVQNMDAVKLMVMAIQNENNREINLSDALKSRALANVQTQEDDQDTGTVFRINYQEPMPATGLGIM